MAGTTLLAASAVTSWESATQRNRIVIQPGAWSHLSSIRFGFEKAPVVNEVELGLDDEAFPQEAARVAFEKPLVVRKISRHRRAQVARAAKQKIEAVSTLASLTTQDQLPTTQASEVPAVTHGALEQAPESQLEAFRAMHRQLRARFLVVIRQPEGTQPAAVQVATQEVTTQSAPERSVAVVNTAAVTTVDDERPSPAAIAAAAALTFDGGEDAQVSNAIEEVKQMKRKASTPSSLTVPTAPMTMKTPVVESPARSYASIQQEAEASYRQIEALSQQVFAAPAQPQVTTHPETARPAPAVLTQSGVSIAALKSSRSGGYSARADYSTLDLFKMWQSWNAAHPAAAPVAPVQAPKARPEPTLPTVTALALNPNQRAVNLAEAQSESSDGTADDVGHGVVPEAPLVVEAFEWSSPVEATSTQVITLEGWNQVQAMDHWSVIHWNPTGQSQAPMISHNTAVMLARIADTNLQPDAAIVFGKIPAGWDVEYSDRAEKVVYLNERNQPEAKSTGTRYFAFLNAAPGAQLMTLKAALGAETAAVAVPVVNGASTFVDLTSVSKRSFNGYVLDASAPTRKGIAGASVEVVGQSNAVFFTTPSGYFNLSEVYAVGDYPVYVETVTPAGYKHRYRVSPDKMDGVELFRLDDKQVRSWLSQLEGGVSPESGLIVAAVPGLIRTYGDGRLFPSVRTLLGSNTLTPETYTVSAEGELEAGAPLEAAAPRYVSVQVPTGPVVSQVEDNNRNVVWSQLVLAQPGVINVVGPF